MNADAIATRMSVLGRALPSRVLFVDDDRARNRADDRSAGDRRVRSLAREQRRRALELIEQQWYPLVITDWLMPVMDGITFTEALRGRGARHLHHHADDARGQRRLRARLRRRRRRLSVQAGARCGAVRAHPAAFNTLALRRSLKEAQAALEQSAAIDTESGAFAASELFSRLHGEIRRAQRYGRKLALMTVRVRSGRGATASRSLPAGDPARHRADDRKRRAGADRLGRPKRRRARRCVRRGPAGIQHQRSAAIKERLLQALRRHTDLEGRHRWLRVRRRCPGHDTGAACRPSAQEMLGDCRTLCRNCPGHTGPEQFGAVQRSVACHVSIVCRHGYVVDNECSLKRVRSPGGFRAGAGGHGGPVPRLARTPRKCDQACALSLLLCFCACAHCPWRLRLAFAGNVELSQTDGGDLRRRPGSLQEFNRALRDRLRASGANLAGRSDATAVVQIIKDESGQRVLPVSARNTPEEYEVFYVVEYSVAR